MQSKKPYIKKQYKKSMPLPKTKTDDIQNKQITSLQKKLKKLEGEPEIKHVDEFNGLAAITNAGLFDTPLTPNPRQGTSDIQRIGDEIQLTSMRIKCNFKGSTALMGPSRIRFIVLWDKQFAGALPPVFTSVNPNAIFDDSIVTDGTLSPRNQNTIDRYEFLHDKIYTLNPNFALQVTAVGAVTTTTQSIPYSRYVDKYFKTAKKVKFVADAGAVTDLAGNVPLLLWISDQAVVANQPILSFSIRINYKDC